MVGTVICSILLMAGMQAGSLRYSRLAVGVTFLAASASGASSPSAEFTGNWVLVACTVLGTLGAITLGVVSLIVSSRRQPPLGEEMHRDFASAKRVDDDIQRLHSRIDDLEDKMDHATEIQTKNQGDAERSRGRLEGKLDAICERLRIENTHKST